MTELAVKSGKQWEGRNNKKMQTREEASAGVSIYFKAS